MIYEIMGAAAALAGIFAILYFFIFEIDRKNKNKNWAVIISTLLICVLMVPVVSFVKDRGDGETISTEDEAKKEALQHKLGELTMDIWRKESEKRLLESDLANLQIRIEKLSVNIESLEVNRQDTQNPEETGGEEFVETATEMNLIKE